MTDRELLELAAKAAGIEINAGRQRERDGEGCGHKGLWTTTTTNWNPLTDDGDALRLAVKLGLNIDVYRQSPLVPHPGAEVRGFEYRRSLALERATDNGASLEAAARRCIVRAAAEIGGACLLDFVLYSLGGGRIHVQTYAGRELGAAHDRVSVFHRFRQ